MDELFKLTSRPRPEDALHALKEPNVQDAAIAVAERMRHLAMKEDKERSIQRRSLINYRQFYVGGVGIGLVLGGEKSSPYEWWVFAAVNSKPSKKATKFCAEMRIMRAARETRCGCIGGLVVIGENQPDGKSGLLRKTLDPCGDCRACMRHPDNRARFRRNTLILTAKPLSQVRYCEPLYKMMAAHEEGWP
ncbi:MAG TPA: hypothetical protein VMH91_02490 [Candidatus Paceibacterota bacterium]|nr:hypothetical protein [Candidatus Paceibacterota bacterium]